MRRANLAASQRDGMTLIEVLLTAMLMGIILVAIYTSVISTVQTKQVIERVTGASKIGPVILSLMADDLEQCYVPTATSRPFFNGDDFGSAEEASDSLNFVTLRPSVLEEKDREGNSRRAEYVETGYFLERNKAMGGFHKLYRREQFFLEEDPLRGGKFLLLYDMVKSLNFQYYNVEKEKWDDSWEIKPEEVGKNPTDPANKNQSNKDEKIQPYLFPSAVKITLIVGVSNDPENDKSENIPLTTFETIVHIPTGSRLTYKLAQVNNNNPNANNNPNNNPPAGQ